MVSTSVSLLLVNVMLAALAHTRQRMSTVMQVNVDFCGSISMFETDFDTTYHMTHGTYIM